MASLSTIHFLSLLLSSFSLLGSRLVHGDGGEPIRYHVVPVSHLLPANVCTTSITTRSDPSKLNLFHGHGPCSPFHPRSKPSHSQILQNDQARVRWLHRKASAESIRQSEATTGPIAAQIPDHTGGSLATGNYLVTVGFGQPAQRLSVVFDTGSDLTWIQCSPCPKGNCYPQSQPLFDPNRSTTYRTVTCGSAACALLGGDSAKCSAGSSSCRYSVLYNDKSTTEGSLVQDTLTLNSNNGVPSFLFGCGDQNSGLFGKAAGLIGLGRDKTSLVSQTTQTYGGVFSYCLPSTSSSSGYLQLGGAAAGNVRFTPMLSKTNEGSFYFVNLVSISVGGQKLPIAPATFSGPGTLMDSGTVITRIPPAAYSTLRSAFRRMMPKVYPVAKPLDILDTCYDITGHKEVKIPAVVFEFEGGAVLDVDFNGLMYIGDLTQACLPFAGNEDDDKPVIIGNVHQRTYHVVYDVANKRIGFGPNGCK